LYSIEGSSIMPVARPLRSSAIDRRESTGAAADFL
jgi:hypothetical protein